MPYLVSSGDNNKPLISMPLHVPVFSFTGRVFLGTKKGDPKAVAIDAKLTNLDLTWR